MKFVYIYAVVLILFSQNIFSQEPEPLSYFPHSVGNIWEYETPAGISRWEITKDSVGSDSSLFLFYDYYKPLYKIQGNEVYDLSIFNDEIKLYYKLDVDSGDTWIVHPADSGRWRKEATVRNKYEEKMFGIPSHFMEIEYYEIDFQGDTALFRYTETLVSDFGLVLDWTSEGPNKILRGCVIDSDTFGVLTTVKENIIQPDKLTLHQNYPNPFNPNTKIKYSIPERSFVRLNIYDVLGRLITRLVNEEKTSGEYIVEFDGSQLSSGIYIYSLSINKKTILKKMTLIK